MDFCSLPLESFGKRFFSPCLVYLVEVITNNWDIILLQGRCFVVGNSSGCLCQFPTAAVINCYKRAGYKQHTIILLRCWRPEIQNESYGAKINVSQELVSSRDTRGEPIPCFSHFLVAAITPWLVASLLQSPLPGHITFFCV